MNIVAIPLPLQRRSVSSSLKTIPDKNGIFTLHAFKDDVKNGFRDKKNLCLWRRDGTSLLQKYIRHSDNGGLIFTSTMVVRKSYSFRVNMLWNYFIQLNYFLFSFLVGKIKGVMNIQRSEFNSLMSIPRRAM